MKYVSVVFILLLAGCVSPTLTPTPTSDATFRPITCADLDAAWAATDWPMVLETLEQLEAVGLTCGTDSLDSKQYAAHINYGVALDNAGQTQAAIEQYQAALEKDGRGQEALSALARLDALPDPTPPPCNPSELVPYVSPPASAESFVSVEGDWLVLNGEPFVVRGVNYYPRHAPWDRFLTEGNLEKMAKELDVIAAAGLNTLRIFLWYDPLFICAPEDAVPDAETFALLDEFISLAREHGLYLIVTLNDLPDLYFRPLYTDWARYDAQTAFIVSRYRDEPSILAWDLRNEGDLDYGARDGEGRFEQEAVLAWLVHAAEIVRTNDDRHLITAGWWGNAAETAETVEVLSFHHWTSAPELVSRIEALREQSAQPILIEEVGFPSWGEDGEASQAQLLGEVLATADRSKVAGWLVWTAFDFTSADGQASPEHHFGLWRTDLTAKPALEILLQEDRRDK